MQIEKILSGGDPRTLKGVDEVIKLVTDNPNKLQELFECLFVEDQVVRMRAGDALEKICRTHSDWLEPYTKRLLTEVSSIGQSSVKWHLAQMLSEIKLNKSDTQQAIAILQNNLSTTSDWIVENLTLESLASFTRKGRIDKNKFIEILKSHSNSAHKSVVSRVDKLLKEFSRES